MTDEIPLVDLDRQHAPIMGELRAAFDRVVEGSAFTLGEEVERFEEEFAAYCGVGHCVGVASGTAALRLALTAAGIGPGDEVIVPAHTFIASALSVLHAGASPVFCDVERGTGLIDLESARAVRTERTAAILPVHLYGQMCDMEAVRSLADREGLAVFEDAAQAHGAAYAGKRAGAFGTAAAFSFYPSKNLGALGDGGAICTDDEQVAERARALRNLGQRAKGDHEVAGFNERLHGLQAALLRVKLPHLDEWNQARRARAAAYREALEKPVETLEERDEGSCVYHLFPVRLPDRDAVQARLGGAGVQAGIHYSPAVHRQPPFKTDERSAAIELPVAEAWARDELSLPIYPELDLSRIERIAELCNMAAKG